jgi:general secretion pathway protein B
MSLILDALKKLDREKSARRNATVNIATEILRSDQLRPGKRIPLYFVAIVLTAVATAAITYALISKSLPPKPAILPAQTQPVTSAPLSREPVHDARDEISRVPLKIQKPVLSGKPAEAKKQPEARSPAASETLSESKNVQPPMEEKKATQEVIREEAVVAPVITKKTPEQTPKVSSMTPPSLKLSAIVWYEEPSKRFAMINGMIATEGSVIDGVKVIEIQPTSVRFLYNDQRFEIPISK